MPERKRNLYKEHGVFEWLSEGRIEETDENLFRQLLFNFKAHVLNTSADLQKLKSDTSDVVNVCLGLNIGLREMFT